MEIFVQTLDYDLTQSPLTRYAQEQQERTCFSDDPVGPYLCMSRLAQVHEHLEQLVYNLAAEACHLILNFLGLLL